MSMSESGSISGRDGEKAVNASDVDWESLGEGPGDSDRDYVKKTSIGKWVDSGGEAEKASDEDIVWLREPREFWASLGDSVRTVEWITIDDFLAREKALEKERAELNILRRGYI